MKKLILIFCLFIPILAWGQEKESKRNILIITCHPDDWEIGMGGTAYLLRDKYQMHVIIDSDGELGNTWNTTGIPDPQVGAMRVKDSGKSGEYIHAINYFFKLPDGKVYATEDAVSKTMELLKKTDPAIVFIHWPVDKSDHAAASAIALMALSKTGMMYDREVYFFEVGKLNHFSPKVFVDISSVWKTKMEIVKIHERLNDETFRKMAEEGDIYNGRTNHCKYAEGFVPLLPFSNMKSANKNKCSLLEL
jgi:LmbE family N-acetylglucosaminyl deacetylase